MEVKNSVYVLIRKQSLFKRKNSACFIQLQFITSLAFELILLEIHLQIQFSEQIFLKWFHIVIFPMQLTSVSPDDFCPYFLNRIHELTEDVFSNLNSHLGAFVPCPLLILPAANSEQNRSSDKA